MSLQRIAAFSADGQGGNPAGVYLADRLPEPSEMQRIAADVGFSETAFAMPDPLKENGWVVRYYSPETEVPFCGHATIALGAALARKEGSGLFYLRLSEAAITVEGQVDGDGLSAALQSPATSSEPVDDPVLDAALELFGLGQADLDPRLPPAVAEAGARHLILGLTSRSLLAGMAYDLDKGRQFMKAHGLVTIALIHAEHDRLFHARNAFASGGVLEDPATGAAAAALAGYLRDLNWPHERGFTIRQGEDMGMPSRISVSLTDEPGASIRVSGAARLMDDPSI